MGDNNGIRLDFIGAMLVRMSQWRKVRFGGFRGHGKGGKRGTKCVSSHESFFRGMGNMILMQSTSENESVCGACVRVLLGFSWIEGF